MPGRFQEVPDAELNEAIDRARAAIPDPWPAFIAGALGQMMAEKGFTDLGLVLSGVWPRPTGAMLQVTVDRDGYSDAPERKAQYRITIEKLP